MQQPTRMKTMDSIPELTARKCTPEELAAIHSGSKIQKIVVSVDNDSEQEESKNKEESESEDEGEEESECEDDEEEESECEDDEKEESESEDDEEEESECEDDEEEESESEDEESLAFAGSDDESESSNSKGFVKIDETDNYDTRVYKFVQLNSAQAAAYSTNIVAQDQSGNFNVIDAANKAIADNTRNMAADEAKENEIQKLMRTKKFPRKHAEAVWQKENQKKVSASVQKARDKHQVKKQSVKDKADNELIVNAVIRAKNCKTLSDFGQMTTKLNDQDQIPVLLSSCFPNIVKEDLKKHIFTEIVQRADISTMPNKSNLQTFANTFTANKMIQFCFEERQDEMVKSLISKVIHKLEGFQTEGLIALSQSISIIICAPTSAGKTMLVIWCAIVMPTLYILPTRELADQFAATMQSYNIPIMHIMGDKVISQQGYRVIIGTPIDVWNFIVLNKSVYNPDYDIEDEFEESDDKTPSTTRTFNPDFIHYVVVDEIHLMNPDNYGNSVNKAAAMQKIIKYFSNKVLVLLSATIGNIDTIGNWVSYLKNGAEVRQIVYKKRFINQTTYVYTGDNTILKEVSPLESLTVSDFTSGRVANMETQIPTKQLYTLVKKICELNPASRKPLSMENYFRGMMIDVNTAKGLEDLVKTHMATLGENTATRLLSSFQPTNITLERLGIPELYHVLKGLKDRKMTNALVAIVDSYLCWDVTKKLLIYMEESEKIEYPLWKQMLEIQNRFHTELVREKSKRTTKVSKSQANGASMQDLVAERHESIDITYLTSYKNAAISFIEREISKWNEEIKRNHNVELNERRIGKYRAEIARITATETLSECNIYAPHPDYTFSKIVINENDMRAIKYIINQRAKVLDKNKKKYVMKRIDDSDTIDYKDAFMRCIERGMICYTTLMSDVNENIRSAIHHAIKHCGVSVIFNDGSYGYGVNLPIRTAVFYNHKFDEVSNLEISNTFLAQFGGRAGRRGLDTRANHVYVGVDHKSMHSMTYRNITGCSHNERYDSLPGMFNGNFKIKPLLKVSLQDFRVDMTPEQLHAAEEANKARYLDNFRELRPLFSKYSAPHIWRLLQETDNAFEILKAYELLAERSYTMTNTITDMDLIKIFASLIFPDEEGELSVLANEILNTVAPTHGTNIKIARLYGANVITENHKYHLERIIKLKDIIQILISINNHLNVSFTPTLQLIRKNLGTLVYKTTMV